MSRWPSANSYAPSDPSRCRGDGQAPGHQVPDSLNLKGSPIWLIDSVAIERLAIGAEILGTGGGGNPYLGKVHAREHVRRGARIVIGLDAVPDDARIISVGGMGLPTVGIERLPQGDECLRAVRALERRLRQPFTHLIPGEIVGANAMEPLIVAAQTGLPVIDADGMGRAFPALQMDTFVIYGARPGPAAFADPFGQTMILDGIADARTLERHARAATIKMGGAAGGAFPPLTGTEVKRMAVPGTISLEAAMGAASSTPERAFRIQLPRSTTFRAA